MDINHAPTLEEVELAFDSYEQALVGNDVAKLDELFWNNDATLRYGATENLVGYDAIRAFRSQRPAANLARTVTCLLYTSPSPRDQRGSRMPSSA